MEKGYLVLVLHAHLPFVRHPEHEDFLEEDWFYEALTETYIPLLDVFENLLKDSVKFRVTIDLTPSLCSMMADRLLMERYERRLNKLIELTEKELIRTHNIPKLCRVIQMYEQKLKRCRNLFVEQYHRDIISAFRRFQDYGAIEIVTCYATHGFAPLMVNRTAARAQVKIGVADYKIRFGRQPRGIWLPECAYYAGDDFNLKEAGIRYFFVETHGILYGTPRPRYGVYAPVYCPSGVAAFGRDMESAHQVWSAEQGYPGDYRYREFYRDVGYDLEYDYVKPYLHSDGVRRNVGLKYHKITGRAPLSQKEIYNPDEALEAAASHAGNFMFNREKQIEHLYSLLGRKPVLVSMYDAELYGHWWFEGPEFLNFLFRKIHYDQKTITTITPSEYLDMYPDNQMLEPSMSSWGDKGYYECWLNGTNDWLYRHLNKCADRMTEIAHQHPSAGGIMARALNQAARELLLAQSSDWAFLMTVKTAIEYATRRTVLHITSFENLYRQIKQRDIDVKMLEDFEYKDNIFPHIDYRVYNDDSYADDFSSMNIKGDNHANYYASAIA